MALEMAVFHVGIQSRSEYKFRTILIVTAPDRQRAEAAVQEEYPNADILEVIERGLLFPTTGGEPDAN